MPWKEIGDEYIPAKLSSKLKPMDVGMNKLFVDHRKHCVQTFMIKFDIQKLTKHTQMD